MARLDPQFSDLSVLLTDVAPEARSKALADFARETIAEADAQNDAAMGFDVQYETLVDGSKTSNLDSVRADGGEIVADWDLTLGVFGWIADQLVFMSPVRSGLYEASHAFYADNEPADPHAPPPATTYFFINLQPYARKIEGGGARPPLSKKAPAGVYQVVAEQAARLFGNMAIIKFSFRSPEGAYVPLGGRRGGKKASAEQRAAYQAHNATRQPAILILPR